VKRMHQALLVGSEITSFTQNHCSLVVIL